MTHKTAQIGDYVSPGQLLFTIVPLERVFVTANFKETQMAQIRPGQRALIHVDTYGSDFEGTVESIAGASGSVHALLPPQNATGNFVKVVQRIPVKILVKPSDAANAVLRPGMNVEATVYRPHTCSELHRRLKSPARWDAERLHRFPRPQAVQWRTTRREQPSRRE